MTKEEEREKNRRYYRAHRDELIAKARVNELHSETYDTERWRERKRQASRRRYSLAKSHVIDKLGGGCKRCGFSDIRALCIDHVKSDGPKDRWYGNMPYLTFLKKVENDKSGKYQILCHNCNWIKRAETEKEWGGSKRGEIRGAAAIARDRREERINQQNLLAA